MLEGVLTNLMGWGLTMTKSRQLSVAIQHLRMNWLSFRLLYLKALIKMYGFIGGLRGSKGNKSIFFGRVPPL